jgi:hypothetical protein
VTGATIAVVFGGAIGVAAAALGDEDPPAKSAAAANPRPGADRRSLPTIADKTPIRPLTHADPLRLWIGGDSLAGSFGPALGDLAGATGVVRTTVDYKVSSGLWSSDFRDWHARAAEQMASADPEAAVFIIGANDTPVVNGVDNDGDGVADWEPEYRDKTARLMDTLVGPDHRTVLWLGSPTLGTQSLNRAAAELNRVMQEEAAKRAPDVVFVDTYKLFQDESGAYSRYIVDENGEEIQARIGDGVHFAEQGAQYLARAVFTILDGRWNLTQQKDGEPIAWTLAPGSGETVPGYRSAPRPRYQPAPTTYTPRTYVTTPPTTTAPTTIVTTPTTTVAPPTTLHSDPAPTTVSAP